MLVNTTLVSTTLVSTTLIQLYRSGASCLSKTGGDGFWDPITIGWDVGNQVGVTTTLISCTAQVLRASARREGVVFGIR
jgi:hypothetical protein